MIESLGTPWKIFRAVTADQNQLDGIYLIVDVLDECEETSRDNLIRHFQQLIDSRPPDTLPFLKIVVTGRPYAKIESVLQPDFCIRLKSEDNEEKINRDITAYVSDQIKNMEADYDDSLLRDIYQSLTVQTGGMFLYTSLIIEDIQKTPSQEVGEELKSVPVGLDDLYQRLLEQLDRQQDISKMATEILMWVIHAPRPMSIDELSWACAINQDHKSASSVDSSLIRSFRRNIKLCAPIVKFDDKGIVNLVYQSV